MATTASTRRPTTTGARRWPRAATALLGLALGSLPSVAGATPPYPEDVQAHYKLASTPPESSQGCVLCHIDDTGGTQSTLRPFGQLMLSLGVAPYDDPSLERALDQVDALYPDLAADIVAGKDPNNDVATVLAKSGAVVDPVPQYGCALAPGERGTGLGSAFAASLLAAFAVVRTRGRQDRAKRKTSPAHPRAR